MVVRVRRFATFETSEYRITMRSRMLLLFAILGVPQWASAEDNYTLRIPNGENPALGGLQTCVICHVRPQGDGDRNDFGFDYENTPGLFNWPELYALDSDGDGQTNGMELGDPDGLWQPGDVPARTFALSFPGDPTSISDPDNYDAGVTLDAGSPDAGVRADPGGGVSSNGGCTCEGTARGAPFGARLVLLLLGVVALRGRRRAGCRSAP
jgi:dopamine beta-monooxygenase